MHSKRFVRSTFHFSVSCHPLLTFFIVLAHCFVSLTFRKIKRKCSLKEGVAPFLHYVVPFAPIQNNFFLISVYVYRFWSWLEWCATSVVQFVAGDYNTECVRHAVVFTASLPVDTRIGSKTELSLYCSPNDKRRELIDNEDGLLLQEESAWEFMQPNDKAYVFLSEGVVKPVKLENVRDFFVR